MEAVAALFPSLTAGLPPNRVALVTRDHKLLRLLKNFVLGSCFERANST